jgi:hypothetical protein
MARLSTAWSAWAYWRGLHSAGSPSLVGGAVRAGWTIDIAAWCRYLLENSEWLEEELDGYGPDDYLIFDCPGAHGTLKAVPLSGVACFTSAWRAGGGGGCLGMQARSSCTRTCRYSGSWLMVSCESGTTRSAA